MASSSTVASLWRANHIRMIIIFTVSFIAWLVIPFFVQVPLQPVFQIIIFAVGPAVVVIGISVFAILKYRKRFIEDKRHRTEFLTLTMEKFLNDLERESPTMFTSDNLVRATNNYSDMLGSGGFGSVYKGTFSDGTVVAVKVLNGTFDERMEQQFMAEVATIGKVRHLNLVRLIGFCIEKNTTALVYEYMSNGSLDKYLFRENNKSLVFEKLHEIAVGTAQGIAYLHEEYRERIIHYDIKPENILLDDSLHCKIADFGLAMLYNRDKSYVTMTRQRGTPGYAAPELWMPFPVTHKCDIYSFGIMLFEIIRRRRHYDANLPSIQQWFPRWVWIKFENKNLEELITECGIEDNDKEKVKRMIKVALWCVQYRPDLRPKMSDVVKMLEGSMDVREPSNPFQQLLEENHGIEASQMDSSSDDDDLVVPSPHEL
ncbi:hypothetical protein QN277_007254 [Acacia crassicarpa]|uniref:Protein kinase domain-containing protein n=1 Tax=Acacia crassicarpa TaxID=499986 RepID=A0AAE1IU84_9FABA|nr:hypothetical protein QN277_007254 [Acacia crassicarpa]